MASRVFASFSLGLAVFAGPAHAQMAPQQGTVLEKVDMGTIEKLRDQGLNHSHIPEDARYLTDVIGPRLTGSPSMNRADQWVAQKMREYGLENVHLEPWKFGRGWEEVSYFGRMTEPFIRPLSGRALAWTGSTKGLQTGPAMIVKAGSVEELAKYEGKLKGAWVLLDEPSDPRKPSFEPRAVRFSLEQLLVPPDPSRQKPPLQIEDQRQPRTEGFRRSIALQNQLRRNGALGVLRRSAAYEGWRSTSLGIIRGSSIMGDMVGSLITPGEPEALPNIRLPDEDFSLIYRNVEHGIPVILEFNIQNRFWEHELMAYNAVGEIPGTDKRGEVVMLGGHLDSWHMGTGATDDGAGSIVMLEAMRILKGIGARPRRTIRIAFWSGEEPELPELQLLGSSAYVLAHKHELDKISAYFNLDSGTGRIRGISSQMNPYAIPIFEQILRPFRDLGVVAFRDEYSCYSVCDDNESFDRVGVPGFEFIQDPIDDDTYHTNIDTYDALLQDDLKQAAVIVASTAYHLAMRDEMFPRKSVPLGTQ
jgi:carboxypeptidase Q